LPKDEGRERERERDVSKIAEMNIGGTLWFVWRLGETALASSAVFAGPRQIQLPFFPSSLFCARVLSAMSCRIVFIVWRTGKRREGRPVVQREIYLIVHLTNVVTPSLIFY